MPKKTSTRSRTTTLNTEINEESYPQHLVLGFKWKSSLQEQLSTAQTTLRPSKYESDRCTPDLDPVWSLSQAPWTIKRTNRWRNIFAACLNVLTFYSVLTSLYYLGFRDPSQNGLYADYSIQFLFAIDIVLFPFVESIEHRQGVTKLDSFSLRLSTYVHWWLFWDFLAIFPFRELGRADVGYFLRFSRIWKMKAVLNQLKGGWVDYMVKYARKRNVSSLAVYIFKIKFAASLFRLMFWMLFIMYTAAALVAFYTTQLIEYGYLPSQLSNNSASGILKNLYYMETTLATIGYGDFGSQSVYSTVYGRLAQVFIMFPGIVMFSYIIAELSQKFIQYRSLTGENDSLPDILSWIGDIEYRFGQLDPPVRNRIIRHFQYYALSDKLGSMAKSYWKCDGTYEEMKAVEQNYLTHLPLHITYKIFDSVFQDVFYKFRTLFGDSSFRYDICPHFQPREFLPGEDILEEGETPRELLLILSGKVGCGLVLGEEIHSLITYEKGGTIIADYGVLSDMPAAATYRVLGDVPVQAIGIPKRPLLLILTEGYPDLKIDFFCRASVRNRNVKKVVAQYKSLLKARVHSAHGFMTMLLIKIFSVDPTCGDLVKALRKLLLTLFDKVSSFEDTEYETREPGNRSYIRSMQMSSVMIKEKDWVRNIYSTQESSRAWNESRNGLKARSQIWREKRETELK